MKRKNRTLYICIVICVILVAFFLFPKFILWEIDGQQKQVVLGMSEYFPVTVDPKNKKITEDEAVNEFLATKHSLLGATASNALTNVAEILGDFAMSIVNAPWYQSIASVNSRVVYIRNGMRKEEIATAFAQTLGWSTEDKKAFLSLPDPSIPSLTEGTYAPGIYNIPQHSTPLEVRTMIHERFNEDVLSRYSTSTQKVVSLKDALTIASLIQRETISTDGMRLISGIMWNRLFINMNLQIDASLQYAKAHTKKETTWWPKVIPADKYIKSPYNTYTNAGLPPTPIANPSIAAILAALNPIETPCIFYFNDPKGKFHCSVKYEDHVRLIKEYY